VFVGKTPSRNPIGAPKSFLKMTVIAVASGIAITILNVAA
jgi:hypothetical protein